MRVVLFSISVALLLSGCITAEEKRAMESVSRQEIERAFKERDDAMLKMVKAIRALQAKHQADNSGS